MKQSIQGFSLLEVVVVIALIAIMGVAAVPSVGMIRKQEVHKLAKEMAMDLYAQRTQAMTTIGTSYSLKLVQDPTTPNKYGYTLSPATLTAAGKMRVSNNDNSRNIHISMQTSGAALTATDEIYFDKYGYIYRKEAPTEEVLQLLIAINYNEASTRLIFDGVTGNYIIK